MSSPYIETLYVLARSAERGSDRWQKDLAQISKEGLHHYSRTAVVRTAHPISTPLVVGRIFPFVPVVRYEYECVFIAFWSLEPFGTDYSFLGTD